MTSEDESSSEADAEKLLAQALVILDDLSLDHAGVHVATAIDILVATPTVPRDEKDDDS